MQRYLEWSKDNKSVCDNIVHGMLLLFLRNLRYKTSIIVTSAFFEAVNPAEDGFVTEERWRTHKIRV